MTRHFNECLLAHLSKKHLLLVMKIEIHHRVTSLIIYCRSLKSISSHYLSLFFQFLYCIASGIPIVHHDWLDMSVKMKRIEDYSAYIVPAGRDITGDIIEQRLDLIKSTPLTGVRVSNSFDIVVVVGDF